MNKPDLLQLNVVPEGKVAWLSYEDYQTLKRLFETVPLPSRSDTVDINDPAYLQLHRFLVETAGLAMPIDDMVIHVNAFTLIRRGYKVETITPTEYQDLCRLMADLAQPDPNDIDLYESGGHRTLFDYLTKQMGLPVIPGRGPAWYRAKALIEAYETTNDTSPSR